MKSNHVLEVLKAACKQRSAELQNRVNLDGSSPEVDLLADQVKQLQDAVEWLETPAARPPTSTPPPEASAVTTPQEEHPGKLRLDGRPFPVPPKDEGYNYWPKGFFSADIPYPANDVEWFDTDNGQWWTAGTTLIDWDTVGSFRRKLENMPVPDAQPPAPPMAPQAVAATEATAPQAGAPAAASEPVTESAPAESQGAPAPAPAAEQA